MGFKLWRLDVGPLGALADTSVFQRNLFSGQERRQGEGTWGEKKCVMGRGNI